MKLVINYKKWQNLLLKKNQMGQEGPESSKNDQEWGFWGFEKTACLGKIWFLNYNPKTSIPIRMKDFWNCIISNYNIYEDEFLKLNSHP